MCRLLARRRHGLVGAGEGEGEGDRRTARGVGSCCWEKS